jgi:hypothetical protein
MRNPVLLRLGHQVARGSETWGNRDFLFALHALSALELVPRSGHSLISSRISAAANSLKVGEIAVVLEVCAQSQLFDQDLLDAMCNAAVVHFNQFTPADQSNSASPSESRQSPAAAAAATAPLQLNTPAEEYCRQLARMATALNTLRYCHLAFYSTVAIWLGYGVGHSLLDKGNAKAIRRYVDEVRSQLNQIALMPSPTLSVAALTTAIDGIHHKCNSVQDIDENWNLADGHGGPSNGKEVFLKLHGELVEVLSQSGWPIQVSRTFPLLQRLPASVLSLDQLSMLKLLRCLRRCTNLAVREGDGTFPQEASLRRIFQILSETFCLSLKEGAGPGGAAGQTANEGRLAGQGALEGKVVARMLATVRPYQTTPSSPPEPLWFFTLRSGILTFLAVKLSAKPVPGGGGDGEGQNLVSVTWGDILQALQCLRNSALGQASVQNVLLVMLRGVAATKKGEQGASSYFDLSSYLRVAQLLSRFHLSSTVRLEVVSILLKVWHSEELSTTLEATSLLDAATGLFCHGLFILQTLEVTELNETERTNSLELNGKLFHVLDLALSVNETAPTPRELTLARTDELVSAVAELLQNSVLVSSAPVAAKSRLISFVLQQIQVQLKQAAEVPLPFLANSLWLLGRLAGFHERYALEFPTLTSSAVKEALQLTIRQLLGLIRSIVKVKVVERVKVNKEKVRSLGVSDEIKAFLKVLDSAVRLPALFRREDPLPGFGSLTEAVAICVALRWPLLSSNEYCQAANLLIQLDIFDVYLIEELQRKTEAWAELHQGALPLDMTGGWNLLSAWERLHGMTPAHYRCLQLIGDALTGFDKTTRKSKSTESQQNQADPSSAPAPTAVAAAAGLPAMKPTALDLGAKLQQLKEKVIQN